MAWKTWIAGDVLTAADITKQGPTLCTSGTRPTGGNLYEGLIITETNTDRVLYYDGTGWIILSEPTQTYTPTGTNIAVGTGGSAGIVGRFKRSDGWIDLRIVATLGTSGFSVTGAPIFSHPSGVQPVDVNSMWQGNATLNDATGQRWHGRLFHDSLNGVGVTYDYTVATGGGASPGVSAAAIAATAPFTWAAGDSIFVNVRFEMSTRTS